MRLSGLFYLDQLARQCRCETIVLSPGMLKLSMTETETIIGKMEHHLQNHPDIALAILYGSAASGRLSRRSDVDLAVCGVDGLTTESCLDLSLALSQELDREVSVIDLEKMEGVILQEVLTKGIVLKRYPAVMARHILRLQEFNEDILPFHKMAFQILKKRYVE